MNDTKTCKICGDSGKKELYTIAEKQFGLLDRFNYFKCGNCGCLQIDEIPQNIGKYYQEEDYYSLSLSSRGNLVRRINALRYSHRIRATEGWDGSLSYIAGAILETILPLDNARFLDYGLLKKSDRILDVGSGAGELLYYMKNSGFDAVCGVDLFIPEDIVYSNGLVIQKGEIFDVCPDALFDVIMFNHSLEHVEEQKRTLCAAKELLCEGGSVIVRIPVCYYAWERYQENWFQLDAPRHFWLHTLDSMRILADKVGFQMKDVIFDSSYAQFMVSRQYEKNIFLSDKRSLSRNILKVAISFPVIKYYSKLAKQLNREQRGDQCVIVLQKS